MNFLKELTQLDEKTKKPVKVTKKTRHKVYHADYVKTKNKPYRQYDSEEHERAHLSEGPMDFLRGAGQEVGRRVAQSAPVQAAKGVIQAGQTASTQGNLGNAIAQLAKALSVYYKSNPTANRSTQPPPVPQGTTSRARSDQEMDNWAQQQGRQNTFSSYLQQISGESLNEGMWDFVKGAGQEVGRRVNKKIEDYANQPSALKDIYRAGQAASQRGNDQRSQQQAAESKQQAIVQLKNVLQLLPKSGIQSRQELQSLVNKYAGQMASQVMKQILVNGPKVGIRL